MKSEMTRFISHQILIRKKKSHQGYVIHSKVIVIVKVTTVLWKSGEAEASASWDRQKRFLWVNAV
jgi:hypothetical protein